MDTDILTIRIDPTGDPDGRQLESLLGAELAYERARTARQRWVGALVVAGLAAAIARALIPEPSWMSALAVVVLTALAVRTALAVAVERRRHHRWADTLALHPTAVLHPPRTD